MIRSLFVAAATFAAVPALADEVRMSAPIEAGSLATEGVSLVAYYVPLADDSFEVTATWLGADDAEPHRLVMRLVEGDAVAFALPGHMETLFTFSRDFDAVTVQSAPAAAPIRNASL